VCIGRQTDGGGDVVVPWASGSRGTNAVVADGDDGLNGVVGVVFAPDLLTGDDGEDEVNQSEACISTWSLCVAAKISNLQQYSGDYQEDDTLMVKRRVLKRWTLGRLVFPVMVTFRDPDANVAHGGDAG